MRYWTECLSELRDYISALKTVDETLLLNHRRKTGVVVFIISINSVIGLATELLTRDVNPFQYFLTYKLSEDHLELFFSAKFVLNGGSITSICCTFQSSLPFTNTEKLCVSVSKC